MATFFDRFVHPRLARVATAGALLWAGSFLVAVAGLAVRGGRPNTAATLFFLSGVVGLVGMLVLALCGLYLLGVRLRRTVGASLRGVDEHRRDAHDEAADDGER